MGEVKEEQKWRHGDVYGIASNITAETLAANGKKIEGKDSGVLAFGEVTGHMHEIDAAPNCYQRYEMNDKKYILVISEGGVNIKHAEHGVGLIPAGVWEERIDREFDYLSHQIRNVAD
jgi:hypothetical protein